jgi:ribose transport system substrate-binding protein
LAVAGVALVLLAGCGKGPEPAAPAGAEPSGKMRIVVIPKGTTHVFWRSVERGARQAGAELGVEVVWKGPLKEDDRGQQIGLVEQFTAEKVAGIVLAPLDATALAASVRAAASRKIPVVIFDSALKGEAGRDFVSFVATDNRKAGRLGGEELTRLLGGKGKVVLLRYTVGSASTEEREQGFLEAMAKCPEIRILEKERYGGATVGEAQKNAENLLDKLREADGVFCPNESTTQGMLNVLRDNGLAGKVSFVGFDTSPNLLEALQTGKIQALVAQDPTRMGLVAVQTMVAHLQGKPVAGVVDTGCRLVTAGNLDVPEIKTLLGR